MVFTVGARCNVPVLTIYAATSVPHPVSLASACGMRNRNISLIPQGTSHFRPNSLIILVTMTINKTEILNKICYTKLVYDRINKKLNSSHSNLEIERMLFNIIEKTDVKNFEKRGKNFYVTSVEHNIRITVNSNTYRVITVDIVNKTSIPKNSLQKR
jgi:hypothetical protein